MIHWLHKWMGRYRSILGMAIRSWKPDEKSSLIKNNHLWIYESQRFLAGPRIGGVHIIAYLRLLYISYASGEPQCFQQILPMPNILSKRGDRNDAVDKRLYPQRLVRQRWLWALVPTAIIDKLRKFVGLWFTSNDYTELELRCGYKGLVLWHQLDKWSSRKGWRSDTNSWRKIFFRSVYIRMPFVVGICERGSTCGGTDIYVFLEEQ